MLRFEIKKVFSKTKNKVAIIILVVLLIITSILTINKVEYVDENGSHSTGISAARKLRETKNEYAGYITEDVLKKALEENKKINNSKEALSDDIKEQDKAYAKTQRINDILDVIRHAFSNYRDYNYYAVDNVSADEVRSVYERRITTLKEYFDKGEEQFTDKEKEFMIEQYENLETPFYYEYFAGWSNLLQSLPTFILILALVIGFLVSGIFSDEFHTKADAIFFSTKLGRNKGILAKIGAGITIISIFYVVFVALYTFLLLFVLGADGAKCPVQLDLYRSVYNITLLQAYIFIVVGGYVGTLFAALLSMWVSTLTRSTTTGIIIPYIVLCLFPFLSRIIPLPELCALFPDQLLEVYIDIKEPSLIEVGGKVMTVATVIIPFYAILCLILQPVMYKSYKQVEVK